MKQFVWRTLPSGFSARVTPFHISMEGMEKVILCRDEKDYDAMVKIICVAARRCNTIVVIYTVVSNHSHIAVLACSQSDADRYGQEVKRMYSMWFSRRYGERSALRHTDVKALWLDSDWYVRNALAYIPRNALDNGCSVSGYKWSSYRAVFQSAVSLRPGFRKVSELRKREREQIMHTGDDLSDVPWLIDENGELDPGSFCDVRFLEQAFNNDPAFFLKTIGGQNAAELHQKLIDQPRKMLTDAEFLLSVNDVCQRWFQKSLQELPIEKKARIIPYLWRTMRTTVPQLARTFGLERDMIASFLGKVGF